MTTLKKTNHSLFLKIPAETAFLRLAPLFVGQGAMGLGLDEEAADELSLAAEEIMAYLVRVGAPGGEVEIRCMAGSHYVQTDFSFPLQNIGLRAFNMTTTVSFDDESAMDEMELLIASRMADQFRISRRPNGNPELTLIKDFSYPEIVDEALAEVQALSSFSLKDPDPGQIKWFLRLVNQVCPATSFPRDFLYPGKVVDMAAVGDYRLLIAVSPTGEIGGGIVWRWEGLKTVELFGPYIFNRKTKPDMGRELMDACIGSVARTSALILINRMPPADMPKGYLEPLGTIGIHDAGGMPQRLTVSFREMHEDMGAVTWAHPELQDFLEGEYQRLYFPREIRLVSSDGEVGESFSVLSAEMDRRFDRVTLRAIWPGADRMQNLRNHLKLIEHEGLALVFFEMDLGSSWQAEFTPDLLGLGFTPQMILPHAGSGDLLIFELRVEMP
jgi:hypothetical protein